MKKLEIDKRTLYILPAVLALAISITMFLFEFGYHIIDMKNICYTVYVNAPENYTEEECIENIKESLLAENIQGFTVVKNACGGHINSEGNLVATDSYMIILMDISRNEANEVAANIQKKLCNSNVLLETHRVDVTFMKG